MSGDQAVDKANVLVDAILVPAEVEYGHLPIYLLSVRYAMAQLKLRLQNLKKLTRWYLLSSAENTEYRSCIMTAFRDLQSAGIYYFDPCAQGDDYVSLLPVRRTARRLISSRSDEAREVGFELERTVALLVDWPTPENTTRDGLLKLAAGETDFDKAVRAWCSGEGRSDAFIVGGLGQK